jgi:hypothetical protein
MEAERKATLQKVKEEEEKERQERIAEESKFSKERVDKMFHIFAFQEELKNKQHV